MASSSYKSPVVIIPTHILLDTLLGEIKAPEPPSSSSTKSPSTRAKKPGSVPYGLQNGRVLPLPLMVPTHDPSLSSHTLNIIITLDDICCIQ
jgi:hypothetical protein